MHRRCSHHAMIRGYDIVGNVTDARVSAADFQKASTSNAGVAHALTLVGQRHYNVLPIYSACILS